MSATIARSEHEISEIIDGLSEQEVSAVNFETSPFVCYSSCGNEHTSQM
jgi:hypothetical protein